VLIRRSVPKIETIPQESPVTAVPHLEVNVRTQRKGWPWR